MALDKIYLNGTKFQTYAHNLGNRAKMMCMKYQDKNNT